MTQEKKINYTILSLIKNELEEVLFKIKDKPEIENWLVTNSEIYGKSVKDWRPFENKTIEELLEEHKLEGVKYIPYYSIMENESVQVRVRNFLDSRINLVFIDPYWGFLQKNIDFITRIAANVGQGDKSICCFIMPKINCKDLKDLCFNNWENILDFYKKGVNHRIIYEIEDILNFKNNINGIPLNQGIFPENSLLFERKGLPNF